MNILKTYANQVVSFHPARLRDEMAAELFDDLCEEFADWQGGHPDGSEADFLDERKEHPMRYATRLAPEGATYLVGPQFYYSFVSALKVAATVTAVVYIVIAAVISFATGEWLRPVIQMAWAYPGTLLWICAAILGVFVALERSGEKAVWLDRWTSADLQLSDGHQAISKGETVFDLAVSTFGLLLVLRIVELPLMVRHDGTWLTGWDLAVPDAVIWTAGVLFAFDIGFAVLRLTRSLWTRALRVTTIVTDLAWIALLGYAATSDPLLTLTVTTPELQDVLGLDRVVHGVLAVICLILAVDVVKHGWRLFRGGTGHPAAA